MYDLFNDPVQNMCRVGGLPVALGLLSGLAIANVSNALHNPVWVIFAGLILVMSVSRDSQWPQKTFPARSELPLVFSGTVRSFSVALARAVRICCAASKKLRLDDLYINPPAISTPFRPTPRIFWDGNTESIITLTIKYVEKALKQ